jgi:hypothetical protein
MLVLRQGQVLLVGQANEVLDQEEILATTYVDPHQLTRLGKHLGFRETLRNQEEFLADLQTKDLQKLDRFVILYLLNKGEFSQ